MKPTATLLVLRALRVIVLKMWGPTPREDPALVDEINQYLAERQNEHGGPGAPPAG